MSRKPNKKKRRAPLPEEIYPELAKVSPNVQDVSRERSKTSAERPTRTLPLGRPVVEGKHFVSEPEELSSRRHTYSSAADRGIFKPTRKSFIDDINFLSDNEALDVQRSTENAKALINAPKNGHKRHSSEDISRLLQSSASRGSLVSLNLSQRSFSLNSISSSFSTDYVESQMVDQEDIITLTVHVRKFSDALSKLRNAFSGNGSDTDSDDLIDTGNPSEAMHVKAHGCLGKVLSNLKEVIHQYPSLQSSEILAAAGHLISKVKSHNYDENEIGDDFYQSIDQLALVFSSSISDFLMGDQDPSSAKAGDDGDDCGDEFAEDGDDEDVSEGDMLDENLNRTGKQEPVLNDILRDRDADLDRVLLRMESGVDFCLQWTKCWSKYVKDIANYVEKRAQLEADYTKQLAKLAQATRTSINEENYLPFQSTFFTALDQDLEYSQRCQQTFASISGSRFMEPLRQRRTVHDRARKDMKDEWTKTCKQLQDSVNSVKTSQNTYYRRKQELEKLNTRQGDVKDSKDDSASVYSVFSSNKGKKEEELRLKVEEAKQFYSHAIKIANETQTEAEKTKVRIVAQTKQLVNECDRTFRSVTRKYFDMMHDLAVPTPIHFKTLAESCQGYEPGKQFEEFVRSQQSTARSTSPLHFEFKQYSSLGRPSSGQVHSDLESPAKVASSPMKAWSAGVQSSDCDCAASPGVSPSSSPQSSKKRRPHLPQPSTDDESDVDIAKNEKDRTSSKTGRPFRTKHRPKTPASLDKVTLSRDASTHTFHKIRSPAKCSECDSYVFNGVECAQCGLSCHKKCLANLYTACTHSRPRPSPLKRMQTFGVGFSEGGGVPVLVTKCVNEINRRGLRVKGIYRVSGVKSKMEGLCQEFEANADSVDLSTQPPHLIASVLKLYIRQLPEPLMTAKLYPELIHLAKETSYLNWFSYDEYESEKDKQEFQRLLERLKEILEKLPSSNYLTTATLVKHLNKVSLNESYNQMSPQNLAIVFGPTILRLESENSTTSLSSLVDMPHQTRIVALMIVNPQLFGETGEDEQPATFDVKEKNEGSLLPDTPVEKFVSPEKEGEPGMPDLYGIRSDRVRGEGLSPMDKLQSNSSDAKDSTSVDRSSAKIDESIKGEATAVFDEPSISLPGSLERKNEFLHWTQEEDELSEREVDTGQPRMNSKQHHGAGNSHGSSRGKMSSVIDESSAGVTPIMPHEDSLVKEIEEEMNKSLATRPSLDFTNNVEKGEREDDFSSAASYDQDDDMLYARHRAKAFSVGKRNCDPEMLAKRGSALMNAFIGDNSTKAGESHNSPHSSPKRALSGSPNMSDKVNSDVKPSDTFEDASKLVLNGEAAVLSSTMTSATLVKSGTNEPNSEISSTDLKDITPSTPGRAATSGASSPVSSRSGDEQELSTFVAERNPRRKRSATYDADRRRMFENRIDKGEKLVTANRALAYGMRSRRQRVSVKDQIKQLEQRENSDSRVLPVRSAARQSAASTNRGKENAMINADLNKVEDKTSVNGSSSSPKKSLLHGNEPLSRVRVKGGHIDPFESSDAVAISPPRGSPVTHRPPVDEKFCALKMDISLESRRTPSDSSEDDDSNSGSVVRGTRLNTWSGRGLTPRDSNHAPEFV